MKIQLIAGITSFLFMLSLGLMGQTKIHDNLVIPANNHKFEVEIHGAGWSATPVAMIFDNKLDEIYSREIINSLTLALRNSPISIDPSEIDYNRDFDYTSTGNYYGLAVRYYPNGGSSKFVIGLSVDKTNVSVSGKTEFNQQVVKSLKADGAGQVELSPILANLHLQYYFSPTKKFSPYLTFGLGAGILNKNDAAKNNFNFDLNTSFEILGNEFSIPANFTYTLQEIEDRNSKSIPGIMPLLQFSFGVKANISDRFNINSEIGIYNGLHLKLGSGFKF